MINGYSIVIMFICRKYFVFDSHSRGPERNICQNGKSILMVFNILQEVENYVYKTYYTGDNRRVLMFTFLHFRAHACIFTADFRRQKRRVFCLSDINNALKNNDALIFIN